MDAQDAKKIKFQEDYMFIVYRNHTAENMYNSQSANLLEGMFKSLSYEYIMQASK